MRFTRRTLTALGRVMGAALGHTDLNTLFYEFNLEARDSHRNLEDQSLDFLRGLEVMSYDRAEEADRILIEVTEKVLRCASTWTSTSIMPQHFDSYKTLLNSLRIEGFEFEGGQLRPTTPTPVALAPELSALENDLNRYGMEIASNHYAQAVENFTRENWEACNGQIRSFIEELFIKIAKRLTSSTHSDPIAALQGLKSNRYLDDAEFNQFKSVWSGIQDNGPHRGLSSEQEALFRLHVSTAIA